MKKISYNAIIGLAVLFFLPLFANAQNNEFLSPEAKVSLLTFAPGGEVYSVWGHTAIRIKDPANNIDEVYNYGTFDFDEPNFLLKFLRGKLNYSLSYDNYNKIYAYYKYFKRGIYEQELNLSSGEKNKLYKLLKENYKYENRYYKYDFFFDNCSTRPLNIIEKSIFGTLKLGKEDKKLTFRQLLDKQIPQYKWLDFGIDLIIGNKADKIPTDKQSAFLPVNLMHRLSNAKVEVREAFMTASKNEKDKKNIKPLVLSEKTIMEFDSYKSGIPDFLSPIWVFTYLFLLEIVIFFLSYRKAKILYPWYDYLWFLLAFVGSLVIIFLWFFTDHQATKSNWNLLWLNPLYIFMFFKKTRKYAAYILVVLLFSTLFLYSFIPQQLHPAIIPITGLLLLKVSKYAINFDSF